MANRIVDSARSILNKFIPDIYIYTDHVKGINSGKSPGFGLSLVAETTNGTFLSAELASNPQGQGAAVLPEDLGRNCAKLLLEEIYREDVILFLRMKKVLKGKCFANVEEVKQKVAKAVKGIKINKFKKCFEQWKNVSDRYIASNEEYFEGD